MSRPEVLLVDLGLPDGDGLDIIRETSRRWPEVLVMVITVFGDEVRVVAAIKAGAAGYLLKDDPAVSIGAALQQLLAGGSPISPAIARHLIRHFRGDTEQPPATERRAADRARNGRAVARQPRASVTARSPRCSSLTPSTVSSYTKNIYEKLAVSSRSEAVYEATRMGLISRSS